MQVSTTVAYRIYSFEAGKKAIAFNTHSKKFMFLEGLSAELLEIIFNENSKQLQEWLKKNELTNDDVKLFSQSLGDFGFWEQANLNNDKIPANFHNTNETPESKHTLNLFQNEMKHNGLYYTFHIDLTNRCNEKCVHCYHPFDKYDYSKELSLNEVKQLVDIIYDLGVFSVSLSGGECLLRSDFFDILEYISNKGMMTIVFTNGMLLTEENVKKIKNYRVKLVSISLYGDNADIHDKITSIKGSFDRTLAGINILKKYNIPFELKCVVLAENIDRIEEIRKLSKELNYGQDCKVDFSLCGKVDGNCNVFSHRASQEDIKNVFFSDPERYFGASQFKKYLKSENETPCGAGKYGLYCSADGSIYPCVSFRLFLCNYKELPYINENSILQKWRKTKISDFTDCFKHDYCKYCTEQCAGNNLIENGNYLDSKNISNCERAKIIAEWFQSHSDDNK